MRGDSAWNNPEPEVVLAVDSRGRIRGCDARQRCQPPRHGGPQRAAPRRGEGQQRELRDRSVHPALRRAAETRGDGFTLDDADGRRGRPRGVRTGRFRDGRRQPAGEISRPPRTLVDHAMGARHQYPDGLALFLGTMFVPTADRLGPGSGFTHRAGDRVTIRERRLGSLVNWVGFSEALPPLGARHPRAHGEPRRTRTAAAGRWRHRPLTGVPAAAATARDRAGAAARLGTVADTSRGGSNAASDGGQAGAARVPSRTSSVVVFATRSHGLQTESAAEACRTMIRAEFPPSPVAFATAITTEPAAASIDSVSSATDHRTMLITDLRVHTCFAMWRNWVFVELVTDAWSDGRRRGDARGSRADDGRPPRGSPPCARRKGSARPARASSET